MKLMMTNSLLCIILLQSLQFSQTQAGWSWFDENIGNQLGDVVKEVTKDVQNQVQNNINEVIDKVEEEYDQILDNTEREFKIVTDEEENSQTSMAEKEEAIFQFVANEIQTVNEADRQIADQLIESVSEIKSDDQDNIFDEVDDLFKSIFTHCTGGPDCQCSTCEAKRRTGIDVSDVIEATFSVCKGFDEGCECDACSAKRKTGITGQIQEIVQENVDKLSTIEKVIDNINQVSKIMGDDDQMNQMKNQAAQYLILMFIAAGACFAIGAALIILIIYCLIKAKNGIHNKLTGKGENNKRLVSLPVNEYASKEVKNKGDLNL